MNLEPLFTAPIPVLIHLATILPAFIIGTWLLFFSTKGSTIHRSMGKIYLTLMSITAVAATFISTPASGFPYVSVGSMRFGPIHLFVPLTVWGVYSALAGVRKGDIAQHRSAMRGLYVGGMLIAGVLAFTPGRVLQRMIFG